MLTGSGNDLLGGECRRRDRAAGNAMRRPRVESTDAQSVGFGELVHSGEKAVRERKATYASGYMDVGWDLRERWQTGC